MTDDQSEAGEVFTPGSPEDVQQMIAMLNTFFASKLEAVTMFQNGRVKAASSTGGTKSACHSDGVNDGDDGGKEPDV